MPTINTPTINPGVAALPVGGATPAAPTGRTID